METVEAIIKRSQRVLGIIGSGDDATVSEQDDALETYNSLVRGLFGGNPVGVRLTPKLAAAGVKVRHGGLYQAGLAVATLEMPDNPRDGFNFGVAMRGTSALTLSGGALIEAAASASLSTAGSYQYIFRGDTGTFRRVVDQDLDDEPFLPEDVHDHLAMMLALRLAPEFKETVTLDGEMVKNLAYQGAYSLALRYGRQGRNAGEIAHAFVTRGQATQSRQA